MKSFCSWWKNSPDSIRIVGPFSEFVGSLVRLVDMRTLLFTCLFPMFLNACVQSSLDVAEPGEEPLPSSEDAADTGRLKPEYDSAGYLDALREDAPSGDAAKDTLGDTGVPGVDSAPGSDSGLGTDTLPLDTMPAPDTAKPDTHCPNPDDWTNCGLCCYPAICVGGAGGTCG